jgi:uncharacterized protein
MSCGTRTRRKNNFFFTTNSHKNFKIKGFILLHQYFTVYGMKDFKLALITGASSGLGAALAEMLSEKRIPLLLAARNEQELQALAAKLLVPVEIYVVDLVNVEERRRFLNHIVKRAPDLIINNAGRGLYGPAVEHPTSMQSDTIELNVQAVVEIALEAAKTLLKEGRVGTIVNISSAAAFFSYPTHCLYAAAKRFVLQFSQGLDLELKSHQIRVLASCPGLIDTPFSTRAGGFVKHSFFTLSATHCARLILRQIEKGKGFEIIDWRYKWLVPLARLLGIKNVRGT